MSDSEDRPNIRASMIRSQIQSMGRVGSFRSAEPLLEEEAEAPSVINGKLQESIAELEEENGSLREDLTAQNRRVVVLEEKLDQVLAVMNSKAFRTVLQQQQEKESDETGKTNMITNTLRGFVSLKKYRFQKDGFDLDLSYITPQIIAMGYPTEGVEAVYRNPLEEAQRFFATYHSKHYRIYNLCCEPQRQYDPAKFGGNVVVFPFQDHNACSLALIRPFCEDVHAWLTADPKNVAAVHCKAGKGRTGTMIAAYLVHSGICATSTDALAKFGTARTMNGKGVTIPSQIRFVHYYGDLVHSGFSLPTYMYTINRIVLSPVPCFHYSALGGGCTPYFVVYRVDTEEHKIFDSSEHMRSKRFKASEGRAEFNNLNVLDLSVGGTVKFQFYHAGGRGGKGVKICHFWLNTAFLPESGEVTLSKKKIDKANHDDAFPKSFQIQLFFEKEDEQPLTEPEYLLDAQGSQYQMQRVQEYLAAIKSAAAAPGASNARLRYVEEEWSDDEQEMMKEKHSRDGGGDPKQQQRGSAASADERTSSSSIHDAGMYGSGGSGGGGGMGGRAGGGRGGGGGGGGAGAGASPAGVMAGGGGGGGGSASQSGGGPSEKSETVTVVYEGWLNKKGSSRRNWKKRWFMLQSLSDGAGGAGIDVLSYYESSGAQEPKGVIPLAGVVARLVNNPAYQQRHPNCFEIVNPDSEERTFFLEPHSGSSGDTTAWINAINKVVKQRSVSGGDWSERQQARDHETMTSI
jgi:phosphatidylinositol-3,4,5-trisphosphate 3-phosphatase/dual-specificity protein phosphatase PTEN